MSRHLHRSLKEYILNILHENTFSLNKFICNIRDSVIHITTFKNSQPYAQGMGFFIKGHYIISPAILFLIPSFDPLNSHSEVDRILGTINNVNNNQIAYSYELEIVGMDPRANIAVLKINMQRDWNLYNPFLNKNHPFLHWGESRNLIPGDTCIILGSSQYIENGITITDIIDNKYVSEDGSIPGELLLISSNIHLAGLPVINEYGRIIGMTIQSKNNPYNLALAEIFMRRPVKAILRSVLTGPGRYSKFLITNNIYPRYIKGWLGISAIIMTPESYTLETKGPKEIIGYLIMKIDELSPVQHILEKGDIITHIDIYPIGNKRGQMAPSYVMWQIPPESNVTIKFKKHQEHFLNLHTQSVPTLKYPSFLDFPWYAIDVPDRYKDSVWTVI